MQNSLVFVPIADDMVVKTCLPNRFKGCLPECIDLFGYRRFKSGYEVETHGRASLQLIFHGRAFLGDDQSVKWHADGWAISPNGDKNIRLFAI
jgi:hypothetical protein